MFTVLDPLLEFTYHLLFSWRKFALCIQSLLCMLFLFGWPPCQRADMILMEGSQHAYDMIHYISGLFGYFYVCEIYVNLIWYLYLFMLNKFCLSLSLLHRFRAATVMMPAPHQNRCNGHPDLARVDMHATCIFNEKVLFVKCISSQNWSPLKPKNAIVVKIQFKEWYCIFSDIIFFHRNDQPFVAPVKDNYIIRNEILLPSHTGSFILRFVMPSNKKLFAYVNPFLDITKWSGTPIFLYRIKCTV